MAPPEDTQDIELDTSSVTVRARIVTLENGRLLLLTDSEGFRLGPVAIGVPPRSRMSLPVSAEMFASPEDSALVRIIAERLSLWSGNAWLVVAGLRSISREFLLELLSGLRSALGL